MKSHLLTLLMLASSLTVWRPCRDPARAGRPEARGLAIATMSDETNLGFGDTKTELRMVLTNASGQVSERRMRFNTLENKDTSDGDWNLMVFDEPRDVKGTAMLTYSHILEPDEQWMFFARIEAREAHFIGQ